MILNKNSTFYI